MPSWGLFAALCETHASRDAVVFLGRARQTPAVGRLTSPAWPDPSAVCALVLSGCAAAHGVLTAPLPDIDPSLVAEVAVIRPSGFKGCAVAMPVMIDGRQVFTIECGKHVLYPVLAGEHVFGISSRAVGEVPVTNATPMTVVARQRYYLRLDSLLWTGATLEPITPEEGERLMTETSPLIAPAK